MTLLRERPIRQLPRLQDGVDVLVQREPSVLHRLQRHHRGDRLADRRSLKHRLRRHRRASLDVGDAVGVRRHDLEVLDDGDADAGHVELLHQLLDDCWIRHTSADSVRWSGLLVVFRSLGCSARERDENQAANQGQPSHEHLLNRCVLDENRERRRSLNRAGVEADRVLRLMGEMRADWVRLRPTKQIVGHQDVARSCFRWEPPAYGAWVVAWIHIAKRLRTPQQFAKMVPTSECLVRDAFLITFESRRRPPAVSGRVYRV